MNSLISEAIKIDKTDQIVFRKADLCDLPQMVEIHMRTNPQAYLTSLGSDFLRAMYTRFILDSSGISVIAVDEATNNVAGVAIGCVNVKTFYRKLGLYLTYQYIKSCCRSLLHASPSKVGIARRYRGQVELFPESDASYFTQLNVSPDFQRKRVGSRLAEHFYQQVLSRGLKRVYLITDEDNHEVRALHEKMGCVLIKEFMTPSEIRRCLYAKDLNAGDRLTS
jgi:ribosomal protein S18 acetylase RimI-like enzyme